MRKYLAVVSVQPEYAKRFCEALQRKEKFYFTAVPFETVALLEQFAKEHPVSFVVADEQLVDSGELAVLPGCTGVAALTEDEESSRKVNCLYRYQSMEEMLRQLSGMCRDVLISDPVTSEGKAVRLTGVYSPANPTLRSAFALTLAAAGKRDHRTLYINLEEFSGIGQLLHYNGSITLSDVLYTLKKDQLDANVLRSMIVKTPNLDYLPPMQYADDVKEVTAEEWVKLIRKIAHVSGYEELIIDLPPSLAISAELIDQCSSVFLPYSSGGMEQARFHELDTYLKMPQHRKAADKMKRMQFSESLPEYDVRGEDISEDLLYGEFGMAVIKEAACDWV